MNYDNVQQKEERKIFFKCMHVYQVIRNNIE